MFSAVMGIIAVTQNLQLPALATYLWKSYMKKKNQVKMSREDQGTVSSLLRYTVEEKQKLASWIQGGS